MSVLQYSPVARKQFFARDNCNYGEHRRQIGFFAFPLSPCANVIFARQPIEK